MRVRIYGVRPKATRIGARWPRGPLLFLRRTFPTVEPRFRPAIGTVLFLANPYSGTTQPEDTPPMRRARMISVIVHDFADGEPIHIEPALIAHVCSKAPRMSQPHADGTRFLFFEMSQEEWIEAFPIKKAAAE